MKMMQECDWCGKEFDKFKEWEIRKDFYGQIDYICPECLEKEKRIIKSIEKINLSAA